MNRSSFTDRAGVFAGVSFRELAQDLGVPNPWRRWTLQGWVEEVAKIAGDPLVRVFSLNDGEATALVGEDVRGRRSVSDVLRRVEGAYALGAGVRERKYVHVVKREPVVPVVVIGEHAASHLVLLHELLASRGVECVQTAALAARLMVEGRARTYAAP